MLKGLLGRKLGMTRIFTDEGLWINVTLLEAGPCTVVQRKTADHDGYEAVQVGFGDVREKRCTKPLLTHFKKAGVSPKRVLREFRIDAADELKPGDEVRTDIFKAGDHVDVSGVSKGKGFQGVMKRHGFGGGPGGHGSNFHRAPGSIGASADPSEVIKGKKLPGQMGNEKITVQNLQVVDVVPEKNLLVVRGAVPGAKGGVVVVKHSVKGSK
ncbi:MAG: 50S ribosomal protein L3 [Candidatus Hydrogenedens sp.]|nr:50S ribosomal protein L3 [Candidatus Hydrogenedentota bacterium]NLF56523.1 50S ribosomal protein L3 [Candidatus Hydrogenedens sp.]